MKLRRGRRFYSVITFIALASGIFLCFQLFSVKFLDYHDQLDRKLPQKKDNRQKGNIKVNEISDKMKEVAPIQDKNCLVEECSADEKKIYEQKGQKTHIKSNNKAANSADMGRIVKEAVVKNKYRERAQQHRKSLTLWDELENSYSMKFILKSKESNVIRGVFYKWASLYRPNTNNMFICLKSKEVIPFAKVNDDYCDCLDHSDEPGTSACIQSRFYCAFQLTQGMLQWVPASRVNDGICDCCDGSDEWDGPPLPDHVQLNDGQKHGSIWQSPCKDHCDELRAQENRMRAMREEGVRLKRQYEEEARGKDNNGKLYGPSGAFYKLSLECYEVKSDKYTYKLCPFKKAEQSWGHTPGNVIGRQSSWLSQGGEGGYQLVMEGGDSAGCPDHGSRETIVHFECGLKDALRSVEESERCTYTMYFSTPAAC